MDQQDMALWNRFNEKVVQPHDPQLFPAKKGPCNVILLHLRSGRDGNQACKIFNLCAGGLNDPDPPLLCHDRSIHEVDRLADKRREEAF